MNPLRSYKETQIKTATPGKLILMLYDGAIKHLNQALQDMSNEHRRYDSISNSLIKAQDIIAELMISLDFDRGGEIAKSLFGLYVFMNRRLLDGNIQKDRTPVEQVRTLLTELRSAWAEVAEKAGTSAGSNQARGVNIAG
ncbi:MAG: flagellar export chaperone FliS [Spirochaetaceae bacterium]|jgi:flagellar protein FliS|nr:MAG: flagellar export chaperone FliS [Spirochaetaceae bacterium]